MFVIPGLLESGKPVTNETYNDFLALFGPDLSQQVGSRYPLTTFNQSGSTTSAVLAAMSRVVTDAGFICPSLLALRAAQHAGVAAYAYRWNHIGSCPWSVAAGIGDFPSPALAPLFGATHVSEVPYVFGNLDDMPFNNGTCNSTVQEYHLSEQMRRAWTGMAARGQPGTPELDWPQLDACQTNGMLFENSSSLTSLDFGSCDFWISVWLKWAGQDLPYVLPGNGTCSFPCNGTNTTSSGPHFILASWSRRIANNFPNSGCVSLNAPASSMAASSVAGLDLSLLVALITAVISIGIWI